MKRSVQGVGGAALMAVLLISCLNSGFYFTADLYPAWMLYGLLLFFGGAAALIRHAAASGNERVGPASFGSVSETLWILSPFILMTVYAFHWLLGPLSVHGTVNQLLRWWFYGLFAVSAAAVVRRKGGQRVLAAAWHAAGALLCGSALLAVCGVLPLPHAVVFSSNVGISASGARLAGLVEYPNTFGMLMAAFLLERLFALLRHEPGAGEARLLRAALPLLPYAAALLLSESRGAWLAAGAALAAGLALQRRRSLAPLLLAAAAFAGAALLYRQLAAASLAVRPVPGLLALAGGWAGSMLAGLGVCRLARSGAASRRRLAWAAGGILAAAGAAAVFLTVQERIVRNFGTVTARGAMYRDAWRLFGQAPWFGQGGETWRFSYRAVQSNPYVGSQVHSGYLDMLLNTGILGTSVLLLMLAAAGVILFRRRRELLPAYAVFALHGAVDLDFSFGVVWLLMFLLAARGLSDQTAKADGVLVQREEDGEPSYERAGKAAGGSRQRPQLARSRHRLSALGTASLLLLWLGLTGGGVWLAFRGEMGHRLHEQAMAETSQVQAAALLRSSLEWNPADAGTALELARRLPPRDAETVLKRSLSYSPGHPGLLFALADNAVRRGDAYAAAFWTEAGFRRDKYNAGEQTKSLEGLFRLARRKLASGSVTEARRTVAAGLALYDEYVRRAADSSRAQVRNDREFGLTREARIWGRELARLERSLPVSE
ncbi:hypothetical protein J2TS6_53450 [Paenibacillus albilobatus]|uniref:O-antigen ligase-related domain-containing protein n=1 Tax=Paenibacillus albilobatus TaxID=2716884 RepID=A0A919XK51_9BACL|nr:O-antigen ligase family protein [Paenibacillus albilobatus]GIO34204.1 hypothetical protein J2TS6_53450 [Paenibacillus albilobatus]